VRTSLTGLLYTFNQGATGGVDIAFSMGTVLNAFPAGTALPTPVSATEIDEAPLPMPQAIDFAFLYDARVSGRRTIFYASQGGAGWQSGPYAVGTAVGASGDNYHIAAQRDGMPPQIGRLWWVTNHDPNGSGGGGTTRLVTSPPSSATSVDVPIALPGGCHTRESDLQPWVTPNGRLLLISSHDYRGAQCASTSDDRRHLFAVPVDPANGQPVAGMPTTDFDYLHVMGFHDQAPSLTFDSCNLLFASDRDGGTELDVFMAPRE
jgi:hypothetical protein